jgi:hypothetical protein
MSMSVLIIVGLIDISGVTLGYTKDNLAI